MPVRSVLLDTDFHKFADDHEALRMLAVQHKRGEFTISGVTTVTGNTWAVNCATHARDAIRNLGLEDIEVHEGAGQPILHRQSDFAHRSRMYGAAFGGAWGNSDLLEAWPQEQPSPCADPSQHAVGYLVDFLRTASESQTILAIGPMTNLALAIRIAPDIVANIGRLVVMGGAFFVPGNVTPSAEFNWWFDPEAAAIVLEQDIPIEVIPLDATDSVVLDCARYRRWESKFGDHPFFVDFHRSKFEKIFSLDRSFTLPAWDALAAACLIDSDLITRSTEGWLSVDCSLGPSYGRVVCFEDAKQFNLEQPTRPRARVVLEVDEAAFWDLYESLVFHRGFENA